MKHTKIGLLLLGIPLLLWILILLFLFRIANIFDAYLMKFPGPLVIWLSMSLCPAAAVYLGVKMIHAKQEDYL